MQPWVTNTVSRTSTRTPTTEKEKCPGAVTADPIEDKLASPSRFVKATEGVDYVHVTPPCSSYSRGGGQLGLRSEPGKHMLKFFELLKLVPNVPMVGVENVANFLKFEDARKGFTAWARKLGYRTHIKVMNLSDHGSVQGPSKSHVCDTHQTQLRSE